MCRQAAAKVTGALLMAVMRGRSSEGVDFLDECARAVVVVGIPYPPLYETSVRLKRAFNRDHEALLGSGDDWYAAEAFRAVNQAIGGCHSALVVLRASVSCLCLARQLQIVSCITSVLSFDWTLEQLLGKLLLFLQAVGASDCFQCRHI